MTNRQKLQLIRISIVSVIVILIAVNIFVYIYANSSYRDFNTLAEVKEMEAGLTLYYFDKNYYPLKEDMITLNNIYDHSQRLCENGFVNFNETCNKVYLNQIPNLFMERNYSYQVIDDGKDYSLEFELSRPYGNLPSGKNCAHFRRLEAGSCFNQ